MKKQLFFLSIVVTSLTAGVGDAITNMPHVQYPDAPLFLASQAGGMAAHLGGTAAELLGLRAQAQLNKKQEAYDAAAAAYTTGALSEKEWARVQRRFAHDKHALTQQAYKSELVVDGLTALGEAVGVRNNLLERGLAVGATGFGVGAKPMTRGKHLLARAVLSVLDGLLSTVRSTPGLYYSRTQLAWTTAAQRTIRLLKDMLRHGVKKAHPRVWIARALQLISVGASFVGEARENRIDNVTDDGHLQYDGTPIFDEQGSPTRDFVDKRLAPGFYHNPIGAARDAARNDHTASHKRRAVAENEYVKGRAQKFLKPHSTGARLTTLWGEDGESKKLVGGRWFYPSLAYGPGEEPNWAQLDHHKLTDQDRMRVIERHRQLWQRQQGLDEHDAAATLGLQGEYLGDGNPPEACTTDGGRVSTEYRRGHGQPAPVEPNWEELKQEGKNNGFTHEQIDRMRDAWRGKHAAFEAGIQQRRIANGQLQDGNGRLIEPIKKDGRLFIEEWLPGNDRQEPNWDDFDHIAALGDRFAALIRRHQQAWQETDDTPPFFDDDGKWHPDGNDETAVLVPSSDSVAQLRERAQDIVTDVGYEAAIKAIDDFEKTQAALKAAVAAGSAFFFDCNGNARRVATGEYVTLENVEGPLEPGAAPPAFNIIPATEREAAKVTGNDEGRRLINAVGYLMRQAQHLSTRTVGGRYAPRTNALTLLGQIQSRLRPILEAAGLLQSQP